MSKQSLGKWGEEYTAQYLLSQGWQIIARNYHSRWGEIDLIAVNGTYIAFVEVKTRRPNSMVSGEEAVTPAKQQKIMLTAESYLLQYPAQLQPRFDVAVLTARDGDPPQLMHFEYYECAF